MTTLSQAVSIHPYFEVQPGKLNEFKTVMVDFVAKTKTESGCLYYDFSICDHRVFCREAYLDAAAVLAHLENVGSCIESVLQFSELARLEIHGPAEEVEKLKAPLADLSPDYYVHHTGVS